MVKKSIYILAGIFFLAGATFGFASEKYNYITAQDLDKRLKQGPSMILVDICPVEQFAKGHIAGSIETHAYPAKTDEEKARLDKALPQITASSDDVVIVCPRGGGGAKNTVDYYKSKSVPEKRLLILEKGMDAWPYEKESK
jgi:rhodanese-related sulfurtransferase